VKLTKETYLLKALYCQRTLDKNSIGGSVHPLVVNFGEGDVQVDGHTATSIRDLLIDHFEFINSMGSFVVNEDSAGDYRTVEVETSDYSFDTSGMIDWFRGEILFSHNPIPTGSVLNIEADGSIAFETVKSAHVIGSHESSLRIKSAMVNSDGLATTLLIDGNISKFVQGHNIFGSLQMNNLLLNAFHKIIFSLKEQGVKFCDQDLEIAKAKKLIQEGEYLVKMLDINFLYDLDNDASVESWLHAAEMNARTRSGRALRDKGTVYMQKHSRRWAVKFYNKWREINSKDKKHKLKPEFKDSGLDSFIDGKLRAEVRLMSLELSDLGLTLGKQFTPQKLSDLFNHYLGQVEMKPNVTLVDEQLSKLPRVAQGTYQLWRSGVNLKDTLPQNTFYRHRRILAEHGVDISFPPVDGGIPNNVVPMMRVLEAKPVTNPTWAYDNNLIAI
jgi:II/X family phage/plasmid replication protein